MPAPLLLQSTRDALGGDRVPHCDSRALFLGRYAVPHSKDDKNQSPRKSWFERLISIPATPRPGNAHAWLPATASLLHTRLVSRLMVGMANGVMENAGLTLDRLGLPVVPGSAVKGCARRAALAALREWSDSGVRPEGAENLLAPLCPDELDSPSALLVRIALVFGWVESDWDISSRGTSTSDFAWACGSAFTTVWREAAQTLAHHLRIVIRTAHTSCPWRSLPATSGSVAFLQASPNRDPGLVLDVVTCHHGDYYESTVAGKVAADTEEPVPVYFPAVKEQTGTQGHFTFALLPLSGADEHLLVFARTCLAVGLGAFGIGAKVNAGHGMFDTSEGTHAEISARLDQERRLQAAAAMELAEKMRRECEAEEKRTAKAALDQAMSGLSPELQEDKKVEMLSETQFDARVRAFCKDPKKGGPQDPERHAIVRALRGPRLAYWHTFKTRAVKGDLATVEQAVRAVSKNLQLGKMP